MYLDLKITLLTFSFLFLIFIICLYFLSKILKKNSVVIGKSEESMKSSVYQYIQNFKEIFVYNLATRIFRSFKFDSFKYTNAEKKYAFLITLPRQLFEVLIIFSLTFILIFYFDQDNVVYNLGVFGTMALAVAKLIPSLNSISSNLATMRQHSYAIEEIRKFLIDKELKKRNFNLKIESNEIEDNKLSTIKISDLNFSAKKIKIFDV